jgi:16S rRNA (guanine527-N7)-methyltransferase
LLDSTQKKVSAVKECLSANGVRGIEAIWGRAEEVEQVRDRFAVVVARAVATLPALVELAAPLLVRAGVFIAFKAALDPVELERGDRAATVCGLEREHIERAALPGTHEPRTLVMYRLTHAPTVALPRRTGKAVQSPLG